MYKIYKITSNHTVDFAAEELKKYLRMMMPREGEISIDYDPTATDGYRLGLMQDFGLDVSEAPDIELDDIVHIDTDDQGGIIAGDNPRSVLLAVYRFLRANGCRWLFPGVDGEFIPMQKVVGVKYHKLADCRYRGQCNEGGEYQSDMIEAIDFTPKIGMNIFMQEFDNPKAYYDFYYDHLYNQSNREPEPVSEDTVLQWKRQCEAEISKRGLQYHDMGHGWTAESFEISSLGGWTSEDKPNIPPESRQYLAELGGVRDLYGGVALNTNFCMSNPEARAKVTKRVCDYADLYRNVDYLHVWLADANNNHCECAACQEKIPSDWYVVLMNEIDAELTKRGLSTRVVFCCYYDTIFPAETEKLNNPNRFSLLLGAITRSYTESVKPASFEGELQKYKRNKNEFPGDVNEYAEYAREWSRRCGMPVLVYEYHFWVNQYYDLSTLSLAKVIHEDIKGYRGVGFGGTIEDGSQRSFFPNGYLFYVYGETLFDTSVSLDYLTEDYFSHAYGKDWERVYEFFKALEASFDPKYLTGKRSSDLSVGKYYNPAAAVEMRKIFDLTAGISEFVKAHKNMPYRAQTVSFRLLEKYLEYCNGIATPLILKAFGAGDEAKAAFFDFLNSFGKHEVEIERYYDQFLVGNAFNGRIFRKSESAIPGL